MIHCQHQPVIVGVDQIETAVRTLVQTDQPLELETIFVTAIMPGQTAKLSSATVGVCIEWHHSLMIFLTSRFRELVCAVSTTMFGRPGVPIRKHLVWIRETSAAAAITATSPNYTSKPLG